MLPRAPRERARRTAHRWYSEIDGWLRLAAIASFLLLLIPCYLVAYAVCPAAFRDDGDDRDDMGGGR